MVQFVKRKNKDDSHKRHRHNRYSNLMHERNIHKSSITNFEELGEKYAYLNRYLIVNKKGKKFYNFEKTIATYVLSKALLKEHYNLHFFLPYIYVEKLYHKIDDIITSSSHNNNNKQYFLYYNEEELYDIRKNSLLEAYNEYTDNLLHLIDAYEEGIQNKINKEITYPNLKNQNDQPKNNFLCPCVPGRANYIHIIADLTIINSLENYKDNINTYIYRNNNDINNTPILLYGNIIKVLDVGVGANCIYPLLGNIVYKWSFIGVDINIDSLKYSYINIILNNKENDILLKYQHDKHKIFLNVIKHSDLYFFTMCNPPYYTLLEEFNKNPFRNVEANIDEVVYYSENNNEENCNDEIANINDDNKYDICNNVSSYNAHEQISNNNKMKENEENYNSPKNDNNTPFIGPRNSNMDVKTKDINSHLHKGGEYKFIMKMINESKIFFYNVIWFTTLVSKKSNVKLIKNEIIQSMRLYSVHKKKQINFLNDVITNNLYFDKFFYFKNINSSSFPLYISQYRIFESYTGRITRWILCWSYYNESQINYLKKKFYEKNIENPT
ncbi:methyltransferase, putative [Plasmodium yoelii]|uniref:Methyltransferase n=3 Tax=Plasmodium yoelii TaxID=5861 RepID=A0AAE9WPZ4_PLAYO|nr:methyltransferase, putative [Plasmodium yoelii]EAA20982.1 putative SAM-dependent methyltransferase [Plasmodium yoelii yoelii]WBY58113.1 methyltransferase [Plasmodium yoelii yoelii]CDU85162.1 conserved protein, unknown function [Plasmodium yoelii]VTZ79057.1 methyltransferase, putative [Plasmodium yoelii]|eukprot:XP_729417.1 methyltransferase, putative [Plasmodium yoelii]